MKRLISLAGALLVLAALTFVILIWKPAPPPAKGAQGTGNVPSEPRADVPSVPPTAAVAAAQSTAAVSQAAKPLIAWTGRTAGGALGTIGQIKDEVAAGVERARHFLFEGNIGIGS